MTTIGNIGIGLFFLVILWILALIVFVVSVRFQSNLGWITLGSALGITILLTIIPLESSTKITDRTLPEEKDFSLIYKYVLLTFLSLCVCIAFIVFFIWHCIEPLRAPRHIKC